MGNWGKRAVTLLAAATATVTVTTLVPATASAVGSAIRGYALGSAAVVVFDPVTDTISRQIPLDGGGLLRVRPDGAEVYVAQRGDGVVRVLDTATNTIATIAVGGSPGRPAFTRDSRRAYVPNSDLGAVQVIDTASRRVVRVIPIDPIGTWFRLWGLEVSPDGTKVYLGRDYAAGGTTNEDVVVIRTATDTMSKVIPLPDTFLPERVVFSPNGRLAMTNGGPILDVTTDTFVRKIPIGTHFAQDFTFTADSGGVLVADTCAESAQGALRQIDVTTGTLLRSLLIGRLPTSLSPTPDRKHLYLTVDRGRNIAVVDTTAFAVEDQFGVSDPARPTSVGNIAVTGTGPAARPGTRFGLAAPGGNPCFL